MGKAKSGGKLKAKKLTKAARRLGGKLLQRARDQSSDTRAVVALCNRCGKADRGAGELASWLRDRVDGDEELRGRLAVKRVGCLGPCPKKKLTVAVGGARAKDWGRGFLIDPRRDRQALLSLLLQRIAV